MRLYCSEVFQLQFQHTLKIVENKFICSGIWEDWADLASGASGSRGSCGQWAGFCSLVSFLLFPRLLFQLLFAYQSFILRFLQLARDMVTGSYAGGVGGVGGHIFAVLKSPPCSAPTRNPTERFWVAFLGLHAISWMNICTQGDTGL